jgi:hypothetical protein
MDGLEQNPEKIDTSSCENTQRTKRKRGRPNKYKSENTDEPQKNGTHKTTINDGTEKSTTEQRKKGKTTKTQRRTTSNKTNDKKNRKKTTNITKQRKTFDGINRRIMSQHEYNTRIKYLKLCIYKHKDNLHKVNAYQYNIDKLMATTDII